MTSYGCSGKDLQLLFDVASKSASRTRSIRYIIVVASILALAGIVNARSGHWMTYRQNMVAEHMNQLDERQVPRGNIEWEKLLLKYRIFYEARAAAYTVEVPLLGTSFDVNDMGIISGVTFTILLILFLNSLKKEIENYRLLISRAKSIEEKEIYFTLIAMNQVYTGLTILSPSYRASSRFLPKLIILLPVIVQFIIVVYDALTVQSVLDAYPVVPITVLFISIVFLLFEIPLVGTIFRLYRELSGLFEETALVLGRHEQVLEEAPARL